MKFQCRRFTLDLSSSKVMGILNVTPDSFSDGGQHNAPKTALDWAAKLIDDGADILDVGGESTRPNAAYVSEEEEWSRVAPILEAVQDLEIPISLDTRRTNIMKKALDKGWVDLINDVAALEDEGAIDLMVAHPDVAICLMHKKGNPKDMQKAPHYDNVTTEVIAYLQERLNLCEQKGISLDRLMVDPGFGFGKNAEHNIQLMQDLKIFCQSFKVPTLIGISRKRTLGQIVNEKTAEDRVTASVTAAIAAYARGVSIVRVHDVRETVHALKTWQAMGIFL